MLSTASRRLFVHTVLAWLKSSQLGVEDGAPKNYILL